MNEMKEKILSVIEKNSKISIKDLAIVLGEPEEEVAKAIYEMESDKTICGYHTIINWDKTNREKVVALIEVRVTPQRGHGFDHIAERIYNFPEVDTVYLMSGAYDFCVMLEGKTLKQVSAFVKALQKAGLKASVREEKGTDIDGACGQLRGKVLKQQQSV